MNAFEIFGWWVICYLWNEFTWAILKETATHYFPNHKAGWVAHWSMFAAAAICLARWY
jgi:hypothetical protein